MHRCGASIYISIVMKQKTKNLLFYPMGTIGRDLLYAFFTYYLMVYIMYTKNLSEVQLGAITAIMMGARVFDAINDPIMGNLIERTRSKHGKYKPWMLIGTLLTGVVVALIFNVRLGGWHFVVFFGIMYILYSVVYTMHDISYWSMLPALSRDSTARNRLTSMATLGAGIGGGLASLFVPMLTVGETALGGNAQTSYGIMAIIIAVVCPAFISFVLFGVKEDRMDQAMDAPSFGLKKIWQTLKNNDQLIWISAAFLFQQISTGIILSGVGSNFIYFEFGYNGGLYSTFTMIGLAGSGILMIIFPFISKKMKRNRFIWVMTLLSSVSYIAVLFMGAFMPTSNAKYWLLTVGYLFVNLGQYGMYLVHLVSIVNTIEYNEYLHGHRDEAIITSIRIFVVKLASTITVFITYLTYLFTRLTTFTNQIAEYETLADTGVITSEERTELIEQVMTSATEGQKMGLLIAITVVPCLLMLASCIIYRRKYKLDEETYDKMLVELKNRNKEG